MLTQAATPSESSQAKPALLFVDDERRVLTSMRAMFRREYDVLLANSGHEAIEILSERDISVVVSDQRMPEMTGVELLSTVKEEHPSSMRILLTGYADLEAVEASINESEVFRYLMKPCPTDELKDAVKLAVQAARVSQMAGVDELAAVPEDQLENIEITGLAEGAEEEARAKQAELALAEGAEDIEVGYLDASELPPEVASGFGDAFDTQDSAEEGAAELESTEIAAQASEDVVDATSLDGGAIEEAATTEGPATQPLDPVLQGTLDDAVQVEKPDPEVLVLTRDADLLEGVNLAIGPQYSVRDADSIDTALRMLSEHPVGVLITDLAVNSDEIDELTRTLKHEVPELVTIIASERSDAALLIGLINHGQIFRFLLKPLQIAQTRIWLNSAMAKYDELCSDSQSVLRHRVVRSAEIEASNSGLFASVRNRIKTIKKRFASSLLTGLSGVRGE